MSRHRPPSGVSRFVLTEAPSAGEQDFAAPQGDGVGSQAALYDGLTVGAAFDANVGDGGLFGLGHAGFNLDLAGGESSPCSMGEVM